LLQMKVIEPSSSPWSARAMLVGKNDTSEKRLVIDYRFLNSFSKSDIFPLSSINDMLSSLQGAKYFSVLDCNKGFYQILMDENSKEMTSFITQTGTYQWLRMPMGLKNSP